MAFGSVALGAVQREQKDRSTLTLSVHILQVKLHCWVLKDLSSP